MPNVLITQPRIFQVGRPRHRGRVWLPDHRGPAQGAPRHRGRQERRPRPHRDADQEGPAQRRLERRRHRGGEEVPQLFVDAETDARSGIHFETTLSPKIWQHA